MTKTATILFCILLFSCSEQKRSTNSIKLGSDEFFLGMRILPDSSKTPDVIRRFVRDSIVVDSVSNIKTVVSDTLYGWRAVIQLVDSLKRPMLDSLNKPKTAIGWVIAPIDSIFITSLIPYRIFEDKKIGKDSIIKILGITNVPLTKK